MSKKSIAVLVLSLAALGITTMTGCGSGVTEETEPAIKTVIDPKNWARVEDYQDYGITDETEPTTSQIDIPLTTEATEPEPTVEETEPPTEPTPEVYYTVAKDNYGVLITSNLNDINISGIDYNLMTMNVSDLEEAGFIKGEAERNSGVNSHYLFDGYQFTKNQDMGEDSDGMTTPETISVDADEDGNIRAIKFSDINTMASLLETELFVGVDLNTYYDLIESVASPGEQVLRLEPADDVTIWNVLSSLGCRAIVACTSDGVSEIVVFTEDYVQSWGPISND